MDLIERMARAHWETLGGGRGRPWADLPEHLREACYDAMWTALHELREPTEEMKAAGGRRAQAVMAWVSMINKLLEVK